MITCWLFLVGTWAVLRDRRCLHHSFPLGLSAASLLQHCDRSCLSALSVVAHASIPAGQSRQSTFSNSVYVWSLADLCAWWASHDRAWNFESWSDRTQIIMDLSSADSNQMIIFWNKIFSQSDTELIGFNTSRRDIWSQVTIGCDCYVSWLPACYDCCYDSYNWMWTWYNQC